MQMAHTDLHQEEKAEEGEGLANSYPWKSLLFGRLAENRRPDFPVCVERHATLFWSRS